MPEAEVRALVAWFAEADRRSRSAMASGDLTRRQRACEELEVRAYFTPGSNKLEVTCSPEAAPVSISQRVGGGT